jgi:hypothetical protein
MNKIKNKRVTPLGLIKSSESETNTMSDLSLRWPFGMPLKIRACGH